MLSALLFYFCAMYPYHLAVAYFHLHMQSLWGPRATVHRYVQLCGCG